MLNIYVIGCGGIGGYLLDLLPQALASASLDAIQANGTDITPLLEKAGNCYIQCVADRLVLIDGDSFNARNALRQGAGAGGKLVTRLRRIKDSMLMQTYLQGMHLSGVDGYITPDNMEDLIPRMAPENPDNMPDNAFADNSGGFVLPGRKHYASTVVFLCVDNVKTRYEVSKYMETFDNCLVINGGNERTTGHVTVYERVGGIPLDPNIMDIYPNITPDADKRPDELACTAVAPKHDQIAVTNAIVANVMAMIFIRWLANGTINRQITRKGSVVVERKNEVVIDIETMTMTPLYHPRNDG